MNSVSDSSPGRHRKYKNEAEHSRSELVRFPVAPKAKEVHLKIININPSSEFFTFFFHLDHNTFFLR